MNVTQLSPVRWPFLFWSDSPTPSREARWERPSYLWLWTSVGQINIVCPRFFSLFWLDFWRSWGLPWNQDLLRRIPRSELVIGLCYQVCSVIQPKIRSLSAELRCPFWLSLLKACRGWPRSKWSWCFVKEKTPQGQKKKHDRYRKMKTRLALNLVEIVLCLVALLGGEVC